MINLFSFCVSESELPQAFPSPFSNIPHPIAQRAALELQQKLNAPAICAHDFDAASGGKMLGVLVVKDAQGQVGYLAAFSGQLANQWAVPGFAPPLFDPQVIEHFLPAGEAELKRYEVEITALKNSVELESFHHQLEGLQQQRDGALSQLVLSHQQRKGQRKALRERLDSSAASQTALIRLSFESQQDRRELRAQQQLWREKLAVVEHQVEQIEQQLAQLKRTRAKLSNRLQRKLFEAYTLRNRTGEERKITSLFENRLPPGGAGDCAAPKLLQYAHQQGLLPLAMAEFWWGASPKDGVRHHSHYYPACRGKCHPILPFMLKGVTVQARVITTAPFYDAAAPETVYEDSELLVINKPSGLLSVPGKEVKDSVQWRLMKRYPGLPKLLLVHRLDMSTSGLLLVAKNRAAHKVLQRQFIDRTVEKRYVAVLAKRLPELSADGASLDAGKVALPLRVDLDDRPRQQVCFTHGKPATTYWQVIERGEQTTRLYFYPHTGRTHQLRLHAAHRAGLNAPILGDELYGEPKTRLLLHAERLAFSHPLTDERIVLTAPAPF